MTASLPVTCTRAKPREGRRASFAPALPPTCPISTRARFASRATTPSPKTCFRTPSSAPCASKVQYVQGSNLRAWLQRILLSVFITRCRRSRRERRALENLTHDPCAWTLPDRARPTRSLSPSVQRALAALPATFRQAVELVDIADLSYRDAAEAIGVPLGTVMSRLHRGRRILAEAFRERIPERRVPEAA